ncbi:hypothetical protein Tco_1101349 [Tanacetum coccineum]
MNMSRVAIKTLVIIIIHKIHRVFSQQYLCCANCEPHYDYQCQPINETYYEPNPSYDSSGFDQPQPPQDFVDSHGILQALNKMQEELEEIKRDRRKKIEDMSIEEMMHEQQLVDYKIKDITNDLESDKVIKSSVEILVPIPSESEGISDDTSDVPTCDNNRVNVEIDLVESLINRDTSIVHSSKIDPILEEFAGELAHIAPRLFCRPKDTNRISPLSFLMNKVLSIVPLLYPFSNK